ncbi:terpene synthase family protein [Streptomyces puniciscabiei]
MPDFSSTFPGPFSISPHADRTERYLLKWVRQFPLMPLSAECRSLCAITGHGVARTLPSADPDSIALCAALFCWLTAFDDTHGETVAAGAPAVLMSLVAELTLLLADDSPSDVPTGPFVVALHDLLAGFRARATSAQYLRLTARIRDNLIGILWEANHLPNPTRVSVSTYCAMRPHTVFVRTILAAVEIVLQYELSDAERSSPSVRQLESATSNLAGWINDLGSFARESARRAALSLPTLLMNEHGHSPEEAFGQISRLCEQQAEIARSRISELSSAASAPVRAHATAVAHIVQCFIWHVGHSRYQA